jgi:hypothetical protein
MRFRRRRKDPPSGSAVDPATNWSRPIRALTFARNWDDVRRAIEAYPELVSDTGIELLDLLIDEMREADDLDGVHLFGQYREVLVLAGQMPLDAAIAEVAGDDVSPELRAALGPLSESLSAGDGGPAQLALIRRALVLASPERTPKLWVSLHGLLGNALLDDHTEDRARNVEDALVAFRLASAGLSITDQPILGAITMNNLARAYTELVRSDAEENSARAREAFHAALAVFTGTSGPRIIAAESEETLVALAGGTAADLRRAIDSFHLVLTAVDNLTQSFDGRIDLHRLAELLGSELTVSES